MRTRTDLEKYFYNIRCAFPIYHAREKEYLSDFKSCINDYINVHDNNVPIENIIEEFGTPAEIVSAYLSNIDSDYLFRNIKRSHYAKCTVVAIMLSLLVIISYRCYRLNKAITHAEQQIVTTVEETIEETTETILDGEFFVE